MICPECKKGIGSFSKGEEINLLKKYFCLHCAKDITAHIKKELGKQINRDHKKQLPNEISKELNQIKSGYKSQLKELHREVRHESTEGSIKMQENGEDRDKEQGYDTDDQSDSEIAHIAAQYKDKKFIHNVQSAIEIQIKNVSEENLKDLRIKYDLLSGDMREQTYRVLPKKAQKFDEFYFFAEREGEARVNFVFEYLDSKDNPSIYTAQQKYFVHPKERRISQQFLGNVNIDQRGVDNSNAVYNIGSIGSLSKESSSLFSAEGEWKDLCVVFDSEETKKRRDEKEKKRNLLEGEKKLKEGRKKFDSIDSRQPLDDKILSLKQARDSFSQTKDCFSKVLEYEEDEAVLKRIKETEDFLENIDKQIEIITRKPIPSIPPPAKVTSGTLLLPNGKKVFLYSRMPLTLGLLKENDIVLRVMPYMPKEQYLENFKKNEAISRKHATISSQNNLFYLADQSSRNGTYINGKKIGSDMPGELITDKAQVSIAKVLDLQFQFYWDNAESANQEKYKKSECKSIYGVITSDCFGIDKRSSINAIKIIRKSNCAKKEKYIILVREITLGSSSSNAVVLEGKNISDIHARIFFRDRHYWIEDLNSLHGVFLNHQKLTSGEEAPLGAEAEIVVGDAKIIFRGETR